MYILVMVGMRLMILTDYENYEDETYHSAENLSHWFYRNIAPKKVINIGRGTCTEELRRKEIDVIGYKTIDEVEGDADLVLCFENTNDFADEDAESACSALYKATQQGGFLIFSSTRKEYWDMLLTKAGFERMEDVEKVMINAVCTHAPCMTWFKENSMFFKVPTK